MRRLTAFAFAVLIGLSSASSSSAAVSTTAAQWYSGATEAPVSTLAGSRTASLEIGESPTIGKKFRMSSKLLGAPFVLTGTGISCSSCTIANSISGSSSVATLTGSLNFKGITVESPGNCRVKESRIATNSATAYAHYMEGGRWLIGVPISSTFILEGNGTGVCNQAGTYSIGGTYFGEFAAPTGTFKTQQAIYFSPELNASAGGSLHLGSQPLELTATADLAAGGAYFGVK